MASSTDQAQGLGETASQAMGEAQDKVQQAAEQARERAVQATEEGRNLIRAQVEDRSSQAGQQIHSTAQDLRTVAKELRNQGQDTPARVAEQIADKGERLAGYLRTSDGDRLLRDVEQFGRRNPWAVIAGGVFLGFAASRVLKSSSAQRYNSDYVSTRSSQQLRSSLQSRGVSAPASAPVSGFSESPVSEGL